MSVNNKRKMLCHFIDHDVMLGNFDVLVDLQNLFGLCSINLFNFADISKFFTNMKVIHSDMKNETIIISTSFRKLAMNIA